MSDITVARYDFSEFEAQFPAEATIEATEGQLRVKGIAIALVASLGLWGAIAWGIVALLHAI